MLPTGATAFGANLQMSLKIVKCQSFQHISLLGFLKFLLYLMPLVHQCLNYNGTKYSKKFEKSQKRDQFEWVTIFRDVCKFASNSVSPIGSTFQTIHNFNVKQPK